MENKIISVELFDFGYMEITFQHSDGEIETINAKAQYNVYGTFIGFIADGMETSINDGSH